MNQNIKDYKSKEGYEISIGIYTEYVGQEPNFRLRIIKDGKGHGFGLQEKYKSFEIAELKRNIIAENFELEDVTEN